MQFRHLLTIGLPLLLVAQSGNGPRVPRTPDEVARPGGKLPGNPKIALVKIADGFVDPTNVASANDGTGRMFVVERVGRIRIVNRDGSVEPKPFLDLTNINPLGSDVQTGFVVINDFQGKQQHYLDGGANVDEASHDNVYLKNLSLLTISLSRMASGEINERDSSDAYLKDPWIVAYPALALLGAIIAARRGTPLLAVALLLAVFWPPLLRRLRSVRRFRQPDVPFQAQRSLAGRARK